MRAGLDYEHNTKNAEQNMTMMGSNVFMAYLWPDVEAEKLGLFFEKDLDNISYGIRYDQVEVTPNKATADPGSGMQQKSANEVYTAAYTGTITASQRDFDNISGFIRFNKDLGHGKSYIT